MASLSYNYGLPLIGYTVSGKRHWLRPGRCDRRTAERIRGHVEALESAAKTNTPVPAETLAWVSGLPAGGTLRNALARHGMIAGGPVSPVPAKPTADRYAIGAVFDAYISRRADLKARTLSGLRQGKRAAVEFFGIDRDIRTISKAEGQDYLRALRAGKAGSTAAGYFKRLRQVLADATDRRLIDANPLAGISAGRQRGEARRQYVPAADVTAVIGQCPDAKWRLLFALCRFGGLRMPSETHGLRWDDVSWDRGRFLVRSPKTERHEGRGVRIVPIFPELLPYLRDALETATPGETHCLQGLTRFPHVRAWGLLRRAGVERWPKLFQNLRASRETDLAARFPLHVVCAWLGNTEAVAKDHYLIVTEADYARAADGNSAPDGAPRQAVVSPTVTAQVKSGTAPAVQNAMNQYPFGESGTSPLDAMTREQQQKTHAALQKALASGQSHLSSLLEALPYIRQAEIDALTEHVREARRQTGGRA